MSTNDGGPATHRQGNTVEPLISISASTLAQLLASHYALALEEFHRKPARDIGHRAYKVEKAVREELTASLGEIELMRLMDRVERYRI